MNQSLEKYELFICLFLIIIYIFINSFCINLFGVFHIMTFVINFLFVIGIVLFIKNKKLEKYYGLVKVKDLKKYLYFVPLFIIVSCNLFNGININNSFLEIIFYILNMFCVGFLEEIIFRGFLFKMMEKDNVERAVIISSLTFGFGHFINLFNGADIISTIIQVGSAIVIGYLFVIIFLKSGSLWPCIITHGLFNALNVFNIDNNISLYFVPCFLIVVCFSYSLFLNKLK